jgi:hypothetical protein
VHSLCVFSSMQFFIVGGHDASCTAYLCQFIACWLCMNCLGLFVSLSRIAGSMYALLVVVSPVDILYSIGHLQLEPTHLQHVPLV